MVDPKCPVCDVQDIEKIVSRDSTAESKGGDPWFSIVQCSECGHVYGVFAKHVINHEVKFIPPPSFNPR